MAGTLFVDIDQLQSYSNNLKQYKTSIEGLIQSASDKMSELSGSWSDSDGGQVVEAFNKLATESQKIIAEIEVLASYAEKEQAKYSDYLKDYSARIKV